MVQVLRLPILFALGAGLTLAACEPIEPQSLEDVEIPEGFHFETTRATAMDFEVAPELRPADGTLSIEVARPDGARIYKGTVSETSDWTASLEHPLPKHVDHVVVTLHGTDWQESVELPVEEGEAFYRFE